MTRRLLVNDGRTERELLLVGSLVVGRDPMCEISADHALLSRRHAEFTVRGDEVRVRDLGSRNGVFVNGVKFAESALRTGDLIQVGNLQVHYVEDKEPLVRATRLESRMDPAAAFPAVALSAVAAAPQVSDDEEYTRLVPPPASAALAAKDDDEELTAWIPVPVARGAPPAAPADQPAGHARLVSQPRLVPVAAVAVQQGASGNRSSAFVFAHVAVLAAVVFLSVLVPVVAGRGGTAAGLRPLALVPSAAVSFVATWLVGARLSRREVKR